MTSTIRRGSDRPLHVHVLAGNLASGGAEAVVAEFAVAAHEAGIRCTVGHIGRSATGQAGFRAMEAGVPVTHVPTTSLVGRDDVRAVHRHLREVSPDLLHTHLEYADVIGGIAAMRQNIPMVSTMHRAEVMPGFYNHKVAAVTNAIRRLAADRIIAISEADRTRFLRSPFERAGRVVAIRNAIGRIARPGAGRAIREERGISPDAPVIAMLSVLRPEKGHDVAIEAFAAVREAVPDAVMMIAGDGGERPRLEEAERRFGPDAFHILGERSDVMEVLDAADVFIQPSRAEGLPMALIEAAAAGLPLIATAVGGMPELVDAEVGLLLGTTPEPAPLAAAIVELLGDDARRRALGLAARARYEADFTASAWVHRYRAVYDEVLDSRGVQPHG
ncbi:glycosyltransferase family 4 protein [Patulibacter minatonensis]|uniref:glycosyltransferase family 4 protein n=1 Tax=Patulibacter minatonensis TaxID=298163 RepID=UPI000685E4B6|nr:glycosyltransferase family 4 protein [Patulibacter minatonensis]